MDLDEIVRGATFLHFVVSAGMETSWRKLFVLSALFGFVFLVDAAGADDSLDLGGCIDTNQVLTQTDGKTLVFANSDVCSYGDTRSGFILRLTKDGEVDTSYGDGGVVQLSHIPDAVGVLAPDGKLVVKGYGGVLRFDVDGRPDPTFDEDGSANLSISANYVAVSATGKIGVLGFDGQRYGIQVLNQDGTIDLAFNGGQVFKPEMDFPGSTDPAAMRFGGLAFSPAGELYSAFAYWKEQNREGLGVFKVTSEGQIDPTYGEGDGTALVAGSFPSPALEYGYAWGPVKVEILADGSAAVGTSSTGAPNFIYPSFGSSSAIVSADGSTSSLRTLKNPAGPLVATAYEFGEDGSLHVSLKPGDERSSNNYAWKNELAGARFGVAGTADLGFGNEGSVGQIIGREARGVSIAMGPGGTMTLGGVAVGGICREEVLCRSVIAISRYDSSGNLDRSFGEGGVVTLPRLRCSPELLGPAACRLPKPRVTVSRGKTSISRDGLRIAIGTGQVLAADRAAWETVTLTLPKPLRLKPEPKLVVYAVTGTKSNRLGPGSIRYRPAKRTLTLTRKPRATSDQLKIVIPRGSLKGSGLSARRKTFRLKATYNAEGTPSTTGYGKLRIRNRR